jgi:hypothetical protein
MALAKELGEKNKGLVECLSSSMKKIEELKDQVNALKKQQEETSAMTVAELKAKVEELEEKLALADVDKEAAEIERNKARATNDLFRARLTHDAESEARTSKAALPETSGGAAR